MRVKNVPVWALLFLLFGTVVACEKLAPKAPQDVVDKAVETIAGLPGGPAPGMKYNLSYTIINRFPKKVGNEVFDCLALKVTYTYDENEARARLTKAGEMERNQKEAHFRRQIEMETQLEEKKADREEKYLASTYRAAARTYGDDPEKYLEKGKKQIQRNKLDAIKRINDHYASIIKILPAEAENEVRRSIEQARAVTRQANEMGREVRISIVHRGNTWYYNPGWP